MQADDDRRAGEAMRRLRALFEKGQVRQQPVDVNEMVRDTLMLMQDDLDNQRIRAHTELGANLPMVSGDQTQLQQVLLNLLSNACDAMADACPHASLLAAQLATPATRLLYSHVNSLESDCDNYNDRKLGPADVSLPRLAHLAPVQCVAASPAV